ncbi:MAG: TetR/AcrR family transcriptional regulator [Actinomycetia bacterium]|nr:TetR/AcrR family transcriptional regulator [Actinomycetes bacterium]
MVAESTGLTKSERTRKSILDAAEELFSANGYEGASLDAIGDRAGIQGTAILYHFSSKQVLYEATLERIFNPLFAELNEILTSDGPVEVRLDAAVGAIVTYAGERPNAARLLLRETASPGGDARAIIEAKARTGVIASIMDVFASQSKVKGVDPVMVANIIVGAVCFYFVGPPSLAGDNSYDPRSPELVHAFSDVMRDLTRSLLRLDWQIGQTS